MTPHPCQQRPSGEPDLLLQSGSNPSFPLPEKHQEKKNTAETESLNKIWSFITLYPK